MKDNMLLFSKDISKQLSLEERKVLSNKMIQALLNKDNDRQSYLKIFKNLYRLKVIKYIEIDNATYKILASGNLKEIKR